MRLKVCNARCANKECIWRQENNTDAYYDTVDDYSEYCSGFEEEFLEEDDYGELDFSDD